MKVSDKKRKHLILVLWVSLFVVSLYIYFFENSIIESGFTSLAGTSLLLLYLVYFVISCLRGFTLIPVTYFIVIGIVLFPPLPLYIMTMFGMIVSSLCIYYFSEYMNFDQYFEEKYPKYIAKIKSFLSKYQLPVVIFWSFAPFLPTDLISYVCGSMKINVRKFILGVLIGKGITAGVYIFLGKRVLYVLI